MAAIAPTKGNLARIKRSLGLATMGYELMDRKRNILIREMMQLMDTAKAAPGRDRFHLYPGLFRLAGRPTSSWALASDIAAWPRRWMTPCSTWATAR